MAAAAPDTWMPFWIGPYLANTLHLPRAQHGSYVLLILACWKAGGILPGDDVSLATIAKCTPKEWKAERHVFAAFFEETEDGWSHARVVVELEKAAGFKAKQLANGLKGGRPPNPNKTHGLSKPNPDESTSPLPTPSPDLTHGDTNTDAARASASPDGPPRPRLTSDEEWTQRLQAYDPSNPRKTWKAFWGWPPDTNGNGHLVPAHLVQWWKAQKAQQRTGTAA